MLENFELHSQIASKIGYSISSFLIAGRILNFMNEYAAAFGVFIGFLTFIVNLRYKHLGHELLKAKIKNE